MQSVPVLSYWSNNYRLFHGFVLYFPHIFTQTLYFPRAVRQVIHFLCVVRDTLWWQEKEPTLEVNVWHIWDIKIILSVKNQHLRAILSLPLRKFWKSCWSERCYTCHRNNDAVIWAIKSIVAKIFSLIPLCPGNLMWLKKAIHHYRFGSYGKTPSSR